MVPDGKVYPLYMSSLFEVCAIAKGAAGAHRSSSLTNADRYGRESLSSNVGRRPCSRVVSSSAWALSWTSGYFTIARKKFDMVETL